MKNCTFWYVSAFQISCLSVWLSNLSCVVFIRFVCLFVFVLFCFYFFNTEIDFFGIHGILAFSNPRHHNFSFRPSHWKCLSLPSLCQFLKGFYFCCVFSQGRKSRSKCSLPRKAENWGMYYNLPPKQSLLTIRKYSLEPYWTQVWGIYHIPTECSYFKV